MTTRPEPVGHGRPEGDPGPAPSYSQESPLTEFLEARLFEQRVIWVRGRLDDLVAMMAATQLMTLDGSGDDPIQLHLNSGEGTLTAALALMDTIAALGVPVEAVCAGRAEGPALGVLAVADRRQATIHSRLRFHDEEIVAVGTADAVVQELAQHQRQLERFIEQVARATHQPAERVEIDLANRRYFDVEEAIQYQLLDGIWSGTTQTTD
ncbi:MAG: ATP-dependent Clp protease proteolytic subunit [Candidatus Dormiibacterota bacterium]